MQVSNYFHYYMFHCRSSDLSAVERDMATATTVFMSIFSLGLVPLVCRLFLYDRSFRLGHGDTSLISSLAQDKLSPIVKNPPSPTPVVAKTNAAALTPKIKIEKDLEPVEKSALPGGFSNGGNTCYMAAALQGLNQMSSFKEAILNYDDELTSLLKDLLDKVNRGQRVSGKEMRQLQLLMIADGAPLKPLKMDDACTVIKFFLNKYAVSKPMLRDLPGEDPYPMDTIFIGSVQSIAKKVEENSQIQSVPPSVVFTMSHLPGFTTFPGSVDDIPKEAILVADEKPWSLRCVTVTTGLHHVSYLYNAALNNWYYCDDGKVHVVDTMNQRHLQGVRHLFYDQNDINEMEFAAN